VERVPKDQINQIIESPHLIYHEQVETGKPYKYHLRDDLVVTLIKHDVTTDIEPDPEIQKHIQDYDLKLQEKMKTVDSANKKLFKILAPINLTFSYVRTNEAPFISLICDLMIKDTGADCAIITSGSIRADKEYEAGRLYTIGDIFDIYPFDKQLCMIEITGGDLYQGLEMGVSKYPALEGRYPQVSGITFEFNPLRPQLERINPQTITVAGKPIDMQKTYRLAVTDYLANGKDGYETFAGKKHFIESESRKEIRPMLLQFFSTID
jgi:5'-nucleotidase